MLRRVAFGIVLASLILLAMLFTALNQQRFDVDIAFARFAVSSGLALLIAFAAGLLAGAAPARADAAGLLGGLALAPYEPDLGPALLVCATELVSRDAIDRLVASLAGAPG